MPIYDFRCEECKRELLDEFKGMHEANPECCGKAMTNVPGLKSVFSFPSEGITLTNVENKPKTFHSTKEMQNYARDNKLELGALL